MLAEESAKTYVVLIFQAGTTKYVAASPSARRQSNRCLDRDDPETSTDIKLWEMRRLQELDAECTKDGFGTAVSDPFLFKGGDLTYCMRLGVVLYKANHKRGPAFLAVFVQFCGSTIDDDTQWPMSAPFNLTLHHPTVSSQMITEIWTSTRDSPGDAVVRPTGFGCNPPIVYAKFVSQYRARLEGYFDGDSIKISFSLYEKSFWEHAGDALSDVWNSVIGILG